MTLIQPYRVITHVDLFAGIGGMRLGVEGAARILGYESEILVSCDINKDAQRTYSRYFGGDYTHHDIRNTHLEGLKGKVDVLTAGFPCQPFSKANSTSVKGDNHRSGLLFLDMLRIIGETLPRVLVLENVPQFASIDDEVQLDTIIASLSDLGYFLWWDIYSPESFVPQRRNRFFLGAVLGSELPRMWNPPLNSWRPTLGDILDPVEEVNPTLHLAKHNWYNLLTKRTHRPVYIPREEADYHQTVTGPLLANGHKGSQDILIMEPYSAIPRVLSVCEMTKLMGFPYDIFKWNIPKTTAHQQLGNSVVPELITNLLLPMLEQTLG